MSTDIEKKLRLIVWGGNGRLGRAVQSQAVGQGNTVVASITREASLPSKHGADVVIDVSGPSALSDVVSYCCATKTPLVECVSNLSGIQLALLKKTSSEIPIVRAENLSYGNYLQEQITRYLASLLTRGNCLSAVAVVERHPATKNHRPSATAQRLVDVWVAASGRDVQEVASVRAGNPVSDHGIVVTLSGASLIIEHKVTDIAVAASGALMAAHWISEKTSGHYDMEAVYESAQQSGEQHAMKKIG